VLSAVHSLAVEHDHTPLFVYVAGEKKLMKKGWSVDGKKVWDGVRDRWGKKRDRQQEGMLKK
jgi:hypothetical protein